MAVVSWLGIQMSRLSLPFVCWAQKRARTCSHPPLRHREAPTKQARQAAPRSGAFPMVSFAWAQKVRGFQWGPAALAGGTQIGLCQFNEGVR